MTRSIAFFSALVGFFLTLSLPAVLPAADEAMVLVPRELPSGGRSSVTVTTVDGSRLPTDRAVSLFLVRGEERHALGSGRTGAEGHLQLAFDVPALESGVWSVVAEVEGIATALSADATLSKAPAILIETDKPIYKPGQTILGRVVLIDNALRPRAGSVELSIHDAKGIRVHRAQVEANEYGVAPFELPLASEVNFGVWKVKASSDGVRTERDVRVERYVLPRYELGVSFPKGWALVDETAPGVVEAKYFFGKPVEGLVEVVASRWVGVWEPYATVRGPLQGGAFAFELPAVGFIAGTPGAGGLGTVSIEVSATDTTGHTQTTQEVLTVSEAPTVLQLIAKSATVKPGMPLEVAVVSESPDGSPLSADVSVRGTFSSWDGSESTKTIAVTTANGLANVAFDVPENTSRAVIAAETTGEARVAHASIELSASWSPTSSFLSVARTGSLEPAGIGEELTFSATSTHPGTIYYDVYAGGRTVWSGASRSREIRFLATPEMAPRAKLVAYVISPDNEVAADSTPFPVEIAATISVATSVDTEAPAPGDEITLTIDTGTRAMVGLSIVDNSVLALGRSRLHLGEVFAELERRFLEPKVETHDDGGNGGPGPGGPGIGGPAPGGDAIAPDFGGGWRTPGASEMFASVGLTLVVTSGLQAPVGRDFWGWAEAVDAAGPPVPGPVADNDAGSSVGEAPRVRQFFPETWVWSPTLLTDESGKATLQLTVPDSITSWSVSSVATGPGGIGFGKSDVVVFQDFFVEPDIPVAVTRGEELPIRVQIYNYLDTAQTVSLQFGEEPWFELLGDAGLSVEVPAGSARSADFPIRPTLVGTHTVQITARGSSKADAVLREITVDPEGEPAELVFNSVIEAGTTLALDTSLPLDAIPDSGKAFLHVTPSPIAQTLSGISGLLNMPFGCGEQNMIYMAPDVEVLRYLEATGEVMPEVEAQAEYFINVGYQRELTFQTADGGFAAFGGEEGSLWLTAFVLSTFSAARDVRDIDEAVLARAASMLLGRQEADGSFRTDDFLIHKEMDGGLSNKYAMSAYVAKALADYGGAEVATALGKAAGYLRDRRSTVNDDAYSLSIAANALEAAPGFEDDARAVVDRLLDLAIQEGIGMHWEPYPVESTGYAALALLAQTRPEAAAAIEWLSTTRNSLGGYGDSTQDTVVAIRALTEAALKIRADLDVTLTVTGPGGTLGTVRVDASNLDILQTIELPVEYAGGLSGGLSLRSEGHGNVGFQVARKFHVPASGLPPSRDMEIEVVYDAERIEVDDLVDVRVRVVYTGQKAETGMTLLDIGVPTGFRAEQGSLDALVEAGTVSRADVAGRKVILYLDGLKRSEPVELVFQVRALFPVRAAAPISKAYEYYDPDVQGSTRGKEVIVLPPTQGPVIFIRGDSNADGKLDISDAIHILGHLFLGTGRITCQDRGDVNDDAALNITDAIVLLEFLFRGGKSPAPPYPDPGLDTTADGLPCSK